MRDARVESTWNLRADGDHGCSGGDLRRRWMYIIMKSKEELTLLSKRNENLFDLHDCAVLDTDIYCFMKMLRSPHVSPFLQDFVFQ